MEIKLDTSELTDFAKQLAKEASGIKGAMTQAMTASALVIQTTSKKPGYVPYLTGNLRRSITNKVTAGSGKISAIFGSNLDYAAIHEFGGKTGRNGNVSIKPSRYLQRAIEDNEKNTHDRVIKAITTGLFR